MSKDLSFPHVHGKERRPDDIYGELDAIVPEGDLQILVKAPQDDDLDTIKHSLSNDDQECPKFFWTNNPPMPEQATSKFNLVEIRNYTPQPFQYDPTKEYLNVPEAIEDDDPIIRV
ncbi:hypothetical protein FXO37_10827 [Capsicum annuum]|nr:hypothetical protein FXO37_10827 [Capsicum annuum]